MASLVSWLKFSGATKEDGTPVSSGRAWFYQVGTTSTQITAYAAPEGIIPLTQPVALDAAGRATVYLNEPAHIVIEEAVTNLEVSVSDKANTVTAQQVEVLQSTVWPAQQLNVLLDSLPSALGTYRESAGATVVSEVYAIGAGELTFQDFGAAGDGVADDTAAILATLVRQAQTKKAIRMNPGTYNFNASIIISSPGAVIRGVNTVNCIFRNTGSQNGVYVNTGSGTESGVLLENFTVTSSTTSPHSAVLLESGTGTTIRGVRTEKHRIGINAVGSGNVTTAYLEDCTVLSTNGAADSIGVYVSALSTAMRCRVLTTVLGRAFVLRHLSRAIHCHAAISATGFDFEDPPAQAALCQATTCTNGYLFAASDSQAVLCVASDCVNGFVVGAVARSGCSFCGSTNSTVADFLTAASASQVVDNGNTFAIRTLAEYGGNAIMGNRPAIYGRARTIDATAAPGGMTWTPDPRLGELQLFVYTGDSTGGDSPLLVAPTATGGLRVGQSMRIVVACNPGPADLTKEVVVSFNGTQYGGVNVATRVGYGSTFSWHFVWAGTLWMRVGDGSGAGGALAWLV